MTACAAVLACHDILATIFDHLAGSGLAKVDIDVEKEQLRRSCRKRIVCSRMQRYIPSRIERVVAGAQQRPSTVEGVTELQACRYSISELFPPTCLNMTPDSPDQSLDTLWRNLTRTLDEISTLR